MSLWDWVLEAYKRPAVPETCLRLQDEFGLNTSFLLWALWAKPEPRQLAQAVEVTKSWDSMALMPLRAVRRALKAPHPPVADSAREALREEVKAGELHAERVLVETLERIGEGPGAGDGFAALKKAAEAFGGAAPDTVLAALSTALE
jgi:uncharacterized protein (TIGR02444 family)